MEDQEPQEGRLNPTYARYDRMTLPELGREMERVRKDLDTVKDTKTALEKEYDFLCTVKIPPAMEAAGLTAMKLESGRGVRVQDEVFVSLTSEQFSNFKDWLIEQGDASIVKETVNSSTLKAYITGRIKSGKEYPVDMVKVSIVPKARFY